MSGARRQRGFTLIEVLVALFVFLAAVTGILALMTTALELHRDGLQVARATRELEDVIAQVQREVAAGQHKGPEGQLQEIQPWKLADGSWCSVSWEPVRGEEPPIAAVRVATSQAALKTARPVRAVLADGPLPAQEAERLRTVRAHPQENP